MDIASSKLLMAMIRVRVEIFRFPSVSLHYHVPANFKFLILFIPQIHIRNTPLLCVALKRFMTHVL